MNEADEAPLFLCLHVKRLTALRLSRWGATDINMSQGILKSLLCVLLFTVSNVVIIQAQEFLKNGLSYEVTSASDLTVKVINGGHDYKGIITIPETVAYKGKDYSVTYIDDCAFCGCKGLTSVIIGNNVTSIGLGAFSESGISSVNLGSGVRSIGESAFYKCEKLTHVDFPPNVSTIQDDAFANSGLTALVIPSTLTEIHAQAFARCKNIASIEIHCPKITNWISSNVYKQSIKSVVIGQEVTEIGRYAFSGCSGLSNINLPNSIVTIGEYNQEIKGETNVEIIPVIA